MLSGNFRSFYELHKANAIIENWVISDKQVILFMDNINTYTYSVSLNSVGPTFYTKKTRSKFSSLKANEKETRLESRIKRWICLQLGIDLKVYHALISIVNFCVSKQ